MADCCASGFEAGEQADIGFTIFLEADGVIGWREMLVNNLKDFSPSVRRGGDMSRFDAKFAKCGGRLGAAHDGDNVGNGG